MIEEWFTSAQATASCHALDRDDGSEIWKFEADPPARNGAPINWFEGNVAMGLDGTLDVPNDNRCSYALDRDDGTPQWGFVTRDQTWSVPALNPKTDRLYMGSNYPLIANIFGIGTADGGELWRIAAGGTVAASPMVAATDPDGLVSVGAFDRFPYGFEQSDGAERWSYGARDHIDASPAQAADGTLRWSIQLIVDERDDLNSSPALGKEVILLSGETGQVFGIPYDYCLRPGLSDDRCTTGPGEALPDEGVFLVFTTSFGGRESETPNEITANQALTFALFVREGGNTKLTAIASDSIEVTTDSGTQIDYDVSGDRRCITVIPRLPWVEDDAGTITVRVKGEYLDEPTFRQSWAGPSFAPSGLARNRLRRGSAKSP